MKIIVFASVKGGVGKTAAAVFTAQALATLGTKVILIDADPNNCATDYFLRDADLKNIAAHSVYHALIGTRKLADCTMDSAAGITIIPSTPTLARAGVELAQDPGVALRFPKAIRALDAEMIIIDTPPSLTLELTLALYAADIILVPVGANRWTVGAFPVVADMAQTVSEATGRSPQLFALPAIVTLKETERLKHINSWTTTNASILKSAAIRNALNSGHTLKEGSLAWKWYTDLATELSE